MSGTEFFWKKLEAEAGEGEVCEICPCYEFSSSSTPCSISSGMRNVVEKILYEYEEEDLVSNDISDNTIRTRISNEMDKEIYRQSRNQLRLTLHTREMSFQNIQDMIEGECALGNFFDTQVSDSPTSLEERVWIQMREWLKYTIAGMDTNKNGMLFFEPAET